MSKIALDYLYDRSIVECWVALKTASGEEIWKRRIDQTPYLREEMLFQSMIILQRWHEATDPETYATKMIVEWSYSEIKAPFVHARVFASQEELEKIHFGSVITHGYDEEMFESHMDSEDPDAELWLPTDHPLVQVSAGGIGE